MNRLQLNLQRKLTSKLMSFAKLCDTIGHNKYEVASIFERNLVSVKNPILGKVADALGCDVVELFAEIKFSLKDNKEKPQNQDLIKEEAENLNLEELTDVNMELLTKSVSKIEGILQDRNIELSPEKKAKAFVAFYELVKRASLDECME